MQLSLVRDCGICRNTSRKNTSQFPWSGEVELVNLEYERCLCSLSDDIHSCTISREVKIKYTLKLSANANVVSIVNSGSIKFKCSRQVPCSDSQTITIKNIQSLTIWSNKQTLWIIVSSISQTKLLSVNCLRNIKSSKLFQSCERCLNTSNDTLITSHTSWLNTSDNLCWNCCGRSNTSSRESTDHDCTQFIGIACGTKEQLIVVNKNLCRSSRNYIADNLCSWIYLCFDGVSCFRNPCTTKELINFLLSPR